VTQRDEISRVERSHSAAQASYDRLSRWYDRLAGGSEQALIRRGVALLATPPGQTALEISLKRAATCLFDYTNLRIVTGRNGWIATPSSLATP
jgi:hypothetical protein